MMLTLISPDSLKSPLTGFLDQDPWVPGLALRLRLRVLEASGFGVVGLDLFNETVFMFLQDGVSACLEMGGPHGGCRKP
jgi:hypothetical protein